MGKYPVQHIRTACPNIDPNQYGAVSGSSTTHALLKILQSVYEATDDNKKFVRLLIIDFSKAFYHINHKKLLKKVENHNVHPIITNCFRSFLFNHQRRVKTHDIRSEWTEINGGVAQGTQCGPELFIHVYGVRPSNLCPKCRIC
jgi:hypothetical protein